MAFAASYAGGRNLLVGVVPALSHLSAGLRAGQRSRVWYAVAATSIAYDLSVARRMRDPRWWPGPLQQLARVIDTAVWALADDGSNDVNGVVMLANTVPDAVVATFRSFAGTEAVPPVDPTRPFPPATSAEARRMVYEIASAAGGPLVALALIRRLQGRRVPWELGLAGLLSVGATLVGVRQRHRLQQAAAAIWAERAEQQVAREQAAVAAEVSSRPTKGHDFKKTLLSIGLLGSAPALAAARATAAAPGERAGAMEGTTVFGATLLSRIEPPDAAVRWLTAPQVSEVHDFLDLAADAAPDGVDQTLYVDDLGPWSIRLRWLGSSILLEVPPPPLAANLNPTGPGFVVAAAFASTALSDKLSPMPRPFTALAIGGNLVLARRFLRTPPSRRELRHALAMASLVPLGAAAVVAARRPPTRRNGRVLYPMTTYCEGLLLPVAANWGLLSRWDRVAFMTVVLGTWLAGALIQGHRSVADFAAEATVPAMTLAGWRVADRVAFEASHLESLLQRRYEDAVLEARHKAERAQLAMHAADLAIAERELEAVRAKADQRTLAILAEDCAQMRMWLGSVAPDLLAGA